MREQLRAMLMNSMDITKVTHGNEALADGKARVEREDMLLVKPVNFDFMQIFTGKYFESWEIRSEYDEDKKSNQGMIRIRQEGDDYRMVVKKFDHEDGNPLEVELTVTKDLFELAKMLFPVGSVKQRYRIPVPDTELEWEVDVYLDSDGKVKSEWVKLDMEYPEGYEGDLPALPFECSEVMGPKFTEEQDEIKEDLFEDVFNIYRKDSMLPIACADDDDDEEDDEKEEKED